MHVPLCGILVSAEEQRNINSEVGAVVSTKRGRCIQGAGSDGLIRAPRDHSSVKILNAAARITWVI